MKSAISVRELQKMSAGAIQALPDLPAGAPVRAEIILAGIDVVDASYYSDRVASAAHVLSDAIASRNGSTSDAHFLACACLLDADIWSHDRDFAGTGWPSWSNANLLRVLDDA